MKKAGRRNAMRNASMASPAPKSRAARITLTAPATLTAAVQPPTVAVSASMRQLVERGWSVSRLYSDGRFMRQPSMAYFLR